MADSLNNQYGFFNHNDYNIDDIFDYTAKKKLKRTLLRKLKKGKINNMNKFKTENVKNLLKSGDTVVFGSGEKAKVFLDYESNYCGKGILAYIDRDGLMGLESYNEDLFTSTKLEHYAINKIYRPKSDRSVMSKNLNDYNLIWERKEIKEMTMEETCNALGYEVKIKKEDK